MCADGSWGRFWLALGSVALFAFVDAIDASAGCALKVKQPGRSLEGGNADVWSES